ncbi:flagellar protein FlgN [Alkalicoccobacillus plakortidis]|uniref:Flagellar protein FlgN n=1 Tax=Alkalicoccobacillus plakortidis TaxID=444060 RepID=A0ABT0XIJ0_9BACI|nr:flagellar protein FlgN [Alkalicoccobacillus plakortidis]MCM2675699.1 flagellar protein FlgN [Alkalicoccobacillus plakortidis]
MMSTQHLVTTMTELVDLHEQLNQLADQKKECLIKQNTIELEALVRNETKLVHRMQVTESIRMKAVTDLLDSKDLPTDQHTFSMVLDQINGEEKSLLTDVYNELTELVFQVKAKNDQNQLLIQDALQYVHVSLDLLAPSAEDFQYTADHQGSDKGIGRSLFDSKA